MWDAAQAAEEGVLRRETPVAHRTADGVLVEGVIDLAFRGEDESQWTVVDFKTDQELKGRETAYRRQVSIYVEALAATTGGAARGVLLVV